MFVGAGISGLAKLDDSSYVASAALSVTDIAESDVKDATLKTIVASKIKQHDQATPDDGTVNGNANGYFTKEGGTPRYVSAKYNDWNVEALYFSRDEDWTTYTDAKQNSGWSEFRFDYSGEVIGFSFDYTLSGTVGWSTELSGRADGTTDLGVSEELGSYCFQYKGADGKYYNVENQEALIADGAWHRYTYVGSGDITNILIKLYHFQGEMLFSNLTIYTQEEATATGKTPIATLPESTIALEEAKIKNMHEWGYYNTEGKDVWYFYGDGTAAKNPEIRFVTPGTNTTTKVDGKYTYAPKTIEGFSFKYKLTNTDEKGVADLPSSNYIVQMLASDGKYPIFTPEIIADGEWHTVTITADSVCTNGAAGTLGEMKDLFSGIVFKMGGFNGELMIADIVVTEPAKETVVDATLKTRNITWADGTAWMAYGTITAAEAGVIPSEASAQTFFAAKSAENIKLVRNGKTYVVGTPDAQSLQVDGYGQFYVKPSFLTYPADFEGVHAPQDGDQIILEGEFYGLSEGYNVGITARFEKTTMTTVWGGSATKPDGKYHCVVAVGEYNYYNMENVKPRPGEGLNDGFYFLADKNDAYAESAWTQNYNGQPNTLAYIRDGKKYYTDREIIICKIREANGNELYYLQGYSVGKLGEILKDGDILVLDGIFQNSVGGNDAIVFDDVRFVLHLADRPQTDSLDWVVTLVNPNVTFKNADGTVISNTGTLAVGTLISAPETNPTMPANDKFTYEFAGWTLNGDLFDFSTAPVGQIDLVAKYNMVPKGEYVDGGYGYSITANHGARDVYFSMDENAITALPDWYTRFKPMTADAAVLIRNGEKTLSNQAVTALCKTGATKYHISGWQFSGSDGFQDGDIVVLNGYFEVHDYTGNKDNGATGEMLYIAETWFKVTVVDGKYGFEAMNPHVTYVDENGGLVYQATYAYGKTFTPAIPANEYFTYTITSCTYNGNDFDATQVYEGALTLVIEYTMTAKNAIETGYAVTDKWAGHDAGNGYFLLPENDAPYAADWSVRYEPVTPDAFVLIRDGVATPKGDVTNSNNNQVLCKISATQYNIAGWYFGGAKNGDIVVFSGYFKGWTLVDGVYQENGTILYIPEIRVQYTEVDGVKAWTVLNAGVVFKDNAGTILGMVSVPYGETLVLNEKDIPVVTKEADAEYTYEFWSWFNGDNSFDVTTPITESLELRPAFSKTPVNYVINVTMPNGTVETINFNVESDVNALLAAVKPADNAEYTYAWGGKGLPDTFDLTNYDFEIVATPVEYKVNVTLVDGTVQTVNYTIETVKEAYATVAGLLPADNAEYTYAWGGKGLPETFDLTHYDLEIVATPVVYTITVTLADGTVETVTFSIESVKEAYATVVDMLPEDTAEYTYAWAEALPDELALQNYNFTVVATAVEPEQPGTGEEPEEPGTSEEPEQPGTSEEPEQPGTSEEPEEPGTSEEPEQPGTSEEPEQPGTSEEPEVPGESEEPEVPSASEEPEVPSDEPAPQPGLMDNILEGCFGGINGITFGVIALGLGVMKLFKKKED